MCNIRFGCAFHSLCHNRCVLWSYNSFKLITRMEYFICIMCAHTNISVCSFVCFFSFFLFIRSFQFDGLLFFFFFLAKVCNCFESSSPVMINLLHYCHRIVSTFVPHEIWSQDRTWGNKRSLTHVALILMNRQIRTLDWDTHIEIV